MQESLKKNLEFHTNCMKKKMQWAFLFRTMATVKADWWQTVSKRVKVLTHFCKSTEKKNSGLRSFGEMIPPTIAVLVILHLTADAAAILTTQPEYVKTCAIREQNFVNCSTHAVQALFDEIPKGVPEIGLDVLDPLQVPIIKILQGAGPVNVNASLSNVSILGFGNTKIVLNKVDPKTYDFYTELRLPRLRIDGKYMLLGRILVIPLRGSGTCWFDAKNLEIIFKSDVKMIKRNGFHFFDIRAVHVKFGLGGLSLYLGNLFDGIKALEETTNAYLNENWQLLADSLNPILSKTIEDIMLDILKKVFDNIPADFFIRDIED